MAGASRRPSGEFYPDVYYTLSEIAIKLGMTQRTLREKYISTGDLRIAELGRGIEIIPGYEVGKFFDKLLKAAGKDDVA